MSADAMEARQLSLFRRTVETEAKVQPMKPFCRRNPASDRAIRPFSFRHAEAGLEWGTASDRDPSSAATVTLATPSQNLELLVGRTTLTQGHSTPSRGTQVRP